MAPRTREFLDKLRLHNIATVDLFTEFSKARQQAADAETPLYLVQDTHWSPHGVHLAASAAAQRLTELGWVTPGQVSYSQKPVPVNRLGDLVQMLQSPLIAQSIPPETVAAVQVINAADNIPYQNKAEAEILVLGDSFLRIYQQDEPTSAGFIAHLAKELKQPLMSLVNDGGGATLVREELAANPALLQNKKLVVWEFVERDFGVALKGWQRIPLPPTPGKQPLQNPVTTRNEGTLSGSGAD